MIAKKIKNSGVSPVVGVILMVAVTVILAAVIGSFVLDLGGSVSQSAQAGVSFDEDVGSSDVDVQLTTVQAADSIWVTTDGSAAVEGGVVSGSNSVGPSTDGIYLLNRGGDGGPGTIVTVGNTSNPLGNDEQISVLGEVDGESTVIQTYTSD